MSRIELSVPLGERAYQVVVENGLMQQFNDYPHGPKAIITNEVVAPLYLNRLKENLGENTRHYIIPDGEAEKNIQRYGEILNALASDGFTRDGTLIALGGGVVGDLTGFIAATYMRGIRFFQFPTTLLSQVDASVGGKTAINLPSGKNLVGAFHQPEAVIIDPDCLLSLPKRHIAAGLSEMLKIGLVRDPDLVEKLGKGATPGPGFNPVLAQSIQNKIDIVVADEREAGERALLNLGHTFGHAIETLTEYGTYLHGEAVAIGISLAAWLSKEVGLLEKDQAETIDRALLALNLPVVLPPLNADEMIQVMQRDKKAAAGKIRFVLLNAIGDAQLYDDVPKETLHQFLCARGAH